MLVFIICEQTTKPLGHVLSPNMNVTSPVSASRTLCESPQGKGNLTGVPRKVKDNCAELYNLIQRWNLLQIQGHKLLREITNIQQNKRTSSENVDQVEEVAVEDRTRTFSIELQQTSNQLLQTVEDLSLIIAKMHQITSQFESLVSLENLPNSFSHLRSEPESNSSPETNASLPVFHTWTMSDYAETSRSVSAAYDLDLKLKRDIVDISAHVQSSDAALFLLSAWSHQPHVSDRVQLRLEAMLTESGHRYRINK